MSKEVLLVEEEITTLILATSRYLERIGEELQGYPDEKPNPEELREISSRIKTVAELRELLFLCRDEGKVMKFSVEEKDILY